MKERQVNPGIREVAKAAGVSIATVSRVTSNPGRVSPKTRSRVSAVMKEMGYAPNAAAQNLRGAKTRRILVTVRDISNPFYGAIMKGAEAEALQSGYALIIGDAAGENGVEEEYAQMLLRQEVDGVVFLSDRIPACLDEIIEEEGLFSPIVYGCEHRDDLPVRSVHIDNFAAAEDVMKHLVELGHNDIAILTGDQHDRSTKARMAGVMSVLGGAGVGALYIRNCKYDVHEALSVAQELLALSERPTAFFCFSDELAMGVLRAVREAGLSCPEDVSIVGFDNIRFSEYLDPPLTTIAQPMEDIGRTAIKMLLAAINGQQADSHIILPHELILRQSTAKAG